jgi:DNA topoisomerase-1
MAKKSSVKRKPSAGASRAKTSRASTSPDGGDDGAVSAKGKKLVIVESPAKAKTINRYLGPDYVVKASLGHVRDLPSKNPKGDKRPVPGVDLDHDFEPTYETLPGKAKVMGELKRAARGASEIWFATDLDREGEAIAWHLAQELGVPTERAKRVVFNAITKDEVSRAFSNPHTIDQHKVDAQQARRVLDRIVGYQVSPLLWKKVARGLSAGRVQSIAVRLVVEREREIRAFVPDETWRITARFALTPSLAVGLARDWNGFISKLDDKGNSPTIRSQNAWLAERNCMRAELVEVGGKPFDISQPGITDKDPADLTGKVKDIASIAGLKSVKVETAEAEKAKGPARFVRTVTGEVDTSTPYKITSIETKRTRSRPSAPFITSTLQQAASSRLGFGAQRTMRTAQRLYEGVEIPGEGAVGLITYMRTDSTHISGDAVKMARSYIERTFGPKYLPEKPNFYSSSNKSAQEAHEAIRPTNLEYTPAKLKNALPPDQLRLYTLIWERFVACQMVPAEWDSTAALITGGTDPRRPLTFRSTGRVLVFDGFYKVTGVPTASEEQTLPAISEGKSVAPFSIDPEQRFGSPPPRYSEASLIKMLESEGIGRPSTYAAIISVIQDRKYVEQVDRRFYATDLGEVVTDKLMEAFPEIMEIGYTRELEAELDHIEDENKDWVDVLHHFYGPFKKQLEAAHADLTHAKAETKPAPDEYRCAKCGAATVYRFGKGGRFLSCSRYPKCDWAAPIDREGAPRPIETSNVACPICGRPMIKRGGRFGAFLGCSGYGAKENPCDGIVKLDKQGNPLAPAVPPLPTDLPCPKCQSPLHLRNGARGPWLSCSAFPKCRGRGKWGELSEADQKKWEAALARHEAAHPIPIIRDLEGKPLTDKKGKPLAKEESAAPDADSLADEPALDQVA